MGTVAASCGVEQRKSSRHVSCSVHPTTQCTVPDAGGGRVVYGRAGLLMRGQLRLNKESPRNMVVSQRAPRHSCAPLRRRNGRALQEPKLTTHSIVKVPRRSVAITHRTASRCVQQVLPSPVLHPSISDGSRCCGIRPSRGLPLRFLGRHTQLEAVLHGSVRQPAAELRRPQAMSGLSPAATSLASIF
jgi:hypothetical protein